MKINEVTKQRIDEGAPAAVWWILRWAGKKAAWPLLKWILKKSFKWGLIGGGAMYGVEKSWEWVTEQIGEEAAQMLIDHKFEIGAAIALVVGAVMIKRFIEKQGDRLVGEYRESISETTSAGSVAAVSMPMGSIQKRNPDGTAKNALDQDNLMGTKKRKTKKKT